MQFLIVACNRSPDKASAFSRVIPAFWICFIFRSILIVACLHRFIALYAFLSILACWQMWNLGESKNHRLVGVQNGCYLSPSFPPPKCFRPCQLAVAQNSSKLRNNEPYYMLTFCVIFKALPILLLIQGTCLLLFWVLYGCTGLVLCLFTELLTQEVFRWLAPRWDAKPCADC